MKAFAVVLAVILAAGCSGMRSSGSSGSSSSGTSSHSADYLNWRSNDLSTWPSMQRHDNPKDPYFGG